MQILRMRVCVYIYTSKQLHMYISMYMLSSMAFHSRPKSSYILPLIDFGRGHKSLDEATGVWTRPQVSRQSAPVQSRSYGPLPRNPCINTLQTTYKTRANTSDPFKEGTQALYSTLLYFALLCFAFLSFPLLYYTILYYTILYYTILYYTILYYTILYYTILYYTILYYTILYYTILYYTILYYTILYYTILYYKKANIIRSMPYCTTYYSIHYHPFKEGN